MAIAVVNPTTGEIENGGGSGDTLTEDEDRAGRFTAVVDDAINGWFKVRVCQSGTPIAYGGDLYIESDVAGSYLVDDASLEQTINITPAFARQDAMIEANTITIRKGTQGWILVTILDENDDPVNLTVYTGLKFLVSVPGATSLQEQTVSVIGTDNNQFYWKPNVASTSKERSLVWSLVNDIADESSQYYKASPADGIILVKDTAVL